MKDTKVFDEARKRAIKAMERVADAGRLYRAAVKQFYAEAGKIGLLLQDRRSGTW